MAVAIEKDESIPGEGEKNGTQGVAALDPNPAARRAAIDLLNRMYDHGVLDLIRAIASGGGDTITRIATATNAPQSLRAMRNGLALFTIFSSLDPRFLENIASNASRNQSIAGPADREPPGLWTIFKRFTSRDSRRALAAIAAGLEAGGRALDAEAKSHRS